MHNQMEDHKDKKNNNNIYMRKIRTLVAGDFLKVSQIGGKNRFMSLLHKRKSRSQTANQKVHMKNRRRMSLKKRKKRRKSRKRKKSRRKRRKSRRKRNK